MVFFAWIGCFPLVYLRKQSISMGVLATFWGKEAVL